MAILDRINNIGKSVAQKSGEIYESGKISVNIKSKQGEIKRHNVQIGTLVYDMYKNGHELDDRLTEICKLIDQAYLDIADLEMEKERVGIDDLDVEVVDAEVSDEEFVVTEEEDEILKDLS